MDSAVVGREAVAFVSCPSALLVRSMACISCPSSIDWLNGGNRRTREFVSFDELGDTFVDDFDLDFFFSLLLLFFDFAFAFDPASSAAPSKPMIVPT